MSKEHDIIWLKSVDSTNEEAKRHISDIDNLSVLSALEQTEGRGQRGNSWTNPPGENLMFSIVLKFTLDARDQFILTEIASLSVVDFLSRHGISAMIKWPNDIYVGEKKICGILIENSIRGKYISSSIIGIGLNINQRNFDVNIPNPTSMVLCRPDSAAQCGPLDLHGSLEEFMDIFISYHDKYLSAGSDLPRLRQLYLERLWLRDQPSRFVDYTVLHSDITPDSGREFHGIIRGLSELGHLIVEDLTCDSLREYGFKEIGYIL